MVGIFWKDRAGLLMVEKDERQVERKSVERELTVEQIGKPKPVGVMEGVANLDSSKVGWDQ